MKCRLKLTVIADVDVDMVECRGAKTPAELARVLEQALIDGELGIEELLEDSSNEIILESVEE